MCYSDYCDIFRCDGFADNMRKLVAASDAAEPRVPSPYATKPDIFPLLYQSSTHLLSELGLVLDENGELIDPDKNGAEEQGIHTYYILFEVTPFI